MDQIGLIQHKGRDIVYVDYSNINTTEELRERVRKVSELELGLKRNDLLELIDVTNSYSDPEMFLILKESARSSTGFVKKAAIIGVVGVKRVLLDVIVRFSGMRIEPKSNPEEAKDWLVQD